MDDIFDAVFAPTKPKSQQPPQYASRGGGGGGSSVRSMPQQQLQPPHDVSFGQLPQHQGQHGPDGDDAAVASVNEYQTRTMHTRKVEEAAALAHYKTLTTAEVLALTREERIRARFEQTQKVWAEHRRHVSRKTGRSEDELVVAHADEWRAMQEELELLNRAKAGAESSNAAEWEASLRGGGERSVYVGNGLYMPVRADKPSAPVLETIRRARTVSPDGRALSGGPSFIAGVNGSASVGDGTGSGARSHSMGATATGAGGARRVPGMSLEEEASIEGSVAVRPPRKASAWRQAPELQKKQEEYKEKLAALRPPEISEEDAAALTVTGAPLFEWALRSRGIVPGRVAGVSTTVLGGDSSGDMGHGATGAGLGAPGAVAIAAAMPMPMPHDRAHHGDRFVSAAHDFGLTFGGLRGDQGTHDEDEAALNGLALDMQRGLLLARGVWTGSAPAKSHAAPNASASAMSMGSGSRAAHGAAGGEMSSLIDPTLPYSLAVEAQELTPGPHAQVLVMSDATTLPGDVGAGVGLSGRVPHVKQGMTLPTETDGSVAVRGPSEAGGQIVATGPWAQALLAGVAEGPGSHLGMTGGGMNFAHTGHAFAATGHNLSVARSWPPVVLEAATGATTTARVRFANTGTVALYVRFVPVGGPDQTMALQPRMTQSLGHTAAATAPDAGSGSTTGPRFTVTPSEVALVPGAVVDVTVAFTSATPGVYREEWEAACTPGVNGGMAIVLGLKGTATAGDVAGPKRNRLEGRLREAGAYAVVREVVSELFDGFTPPPPPKSPEQQQAEAEALFKLQNPGYWYRPEVMAQLESIAGRAYDCLGTPAWQRGWAAKPSLAALSTLVDSLQPWPETAQEKAQRKAMEKAAREAARAAAEAEAKAKADEEAKKKAEEEAAAGKGKGAKKPATPAVTARPTSPTPAAGKGAAAPAAAAAEGGSGDAAAAAADAAAASASAAAVANIAGPAEVRAEKTHALRHALTLELAAATVACSSCPPDRSPLYVSMRGLLVDLITRVPVIAGGAREAVKLGPRPGKGDVVPKAGLTLHDEVLHTLYGKKGRPPKRERVMRPKLGRDGQHHMVPANPDDGWEDLLAADAEPDEEEEAWAVGEDQDPPPDSIDLAHRETWTHFNARLGQATNAARAAAREGKARAEEKARADAEAAAAAAAAAAAEAEAKAKGGKGGKPAPAAAVRAASPGPNKGAAGAASASRPASAAVGSSGALVMPPIAAEVVRLSHPLSALVPSPLLPYDAATYEASDPAREAYLTRLAHGVKREVARALGRMGHLAAQVQSDRLRQHRVGTGMDMSHKLSLTDVDVSGRIVLIRAPFDGLGHGVLREACCQVTAGASTTPLPGPAPSPVELLAGHRLVQASLPSIRHGQGAGARLVLLMASQGHARLPYPDDKAAGVGQPASTWPPVAWGKQETGALSTCEAWDSALTCAATAPLARHEVMGGLLPAATAADGAAAAAGPGAGGMAPPTALQPVARTYTASSFLGLAAALSCPAALGSPVVLLRLTSPDSFALFVEGKRVEPGEEVKRGGQAAGLCKALQAAAAQAADFAEFSRALASHPALAPSSSGSAPRAPVLLLENLLHPDTYAAEQGSRRLFGMSRARSMLPFPSGHPTLDGASVKEWTIRHTALWLHRLCPGFLHEGRWGGYVTSFIHHKVDGKALVRWLSGDLPAPEPEKKEEPAPAPVVPEPAPAPAPASGKGTRPPSAVKPGSSKGGAPAPAPVEAAPEPAPAPAPAAPPPPPTYQVKLRYQLRLLGVSDGGDVGLIVAGLEMLRARHEVEEAAAARTASIYSWANEQEGAAAAAVDEGAARLAATLKLQSCMRGYVVRKKKAAAKARTEARRRKEGLDKAGNKPAGVGVGMLKQLSSSNVYADEAALMGANGSSTSSRPNSSQAKAQAPTRVAHKDAVSLAAFTVKLTAHAFVSQPARAQAAVRAMLGAACDVFVQDSLAGAAHATASSEGIRPARSAVMRLEATEGAVGKSAWVRAHGYGEDPQAKEAAAKLRAKVVTGRRGRGSIVSSVPTGAVVDHSATLDEAAATEIQRLYRGFRGRGSKDGSSSPGKGRRATKKAAQPHDDDVVTTNSGVLAGLGPAKAAASTEDLRVQRPEWRPDSPGKAAAASGPAAGGAQQKEPSGSSSSSSSPSVSPTAAGSRPALPPGDGRRVLGLHLARQVRQLAALVDPLSPPKGPVVFVLGGGHDLRAKCAALRSFIPVANTIALTGLMGMAWLVHVEAAGLPGVGAVPALAGATQEQLAGSTPALASYWHQAGLELQQLARAAKREGVTIIPPLDVVVCGRRFDLRLANPLPIEAGAGGAPLTPAAALAALEQAKGGLAKGVPGEEWAVPVDSEDEVGSDEYDSDDSTDMARLKGRNDRRKARAAAEVAARQAKAQADAARAASRPAIPEEADATITPSVYGQSGVEVVLPPNPRGQAEWLLPDTETAAQEHGWEVPSRTVDLAAGGRLGGGDWVYDIGPRTTGLISDALAEAGTAVVFGPCGLVEVEAGASASAEILAALQAATATGTHTAVLGGATAAFARRAGFTTEAPAPAPPTKQAGGGRMSPSRFGQQGGAQSKPSDFSLVVEDAAVLLCNAVVPGLAMLSTPERD